MALLWEAIDFSLRINFHISCLCINCAYKALFSAVLLQYGGRHSNDLYSQGVFEEEDNSEPGMYFNNQFRAQDGKDVSQFA